MQTLSDVCLKRTRSLDTSTFSALEVLDDNRTVKIYLLTYLHEPKSYWKDDDDDDDDRNTRTQPFYGHYTDQPVLTGIPSYNWRILFDMLLLMATNAFMSGRNARVFLKSVAYTVSTMLNV